MFATSVNLKLTLVITALLTSALAHSQNIHTGNALLRAMHDRYHSRRRRDTFRLSPDNGKRGKRIDDRRIQ